MSAWILIKKSVPQVFLTLARLIFFDLKCFIRPCELSSGCQNQTHLLLTVEIVE